MLAGLLIVICGTSTVIGALGLTLILLPMPDHNSWLAAVVVGEQSFWILPIACLGGISGIIYRLIAGRNIFVSISGVVSALIVLVATVLTLHAFSYAQSQGCKLSLPTYIFGERDWCSAEKSVSSILFAQPAGQDLKADVYPPSFQAYDRTNTSDAFKHSASPCIIIVHGGGWRHGHRSEYRQFDCWLSSQGYVVFDIDYRLAKEKFRFPTQLQDVNTAVDWVREHAPTYGGDPDRIVLLGRSAGAHLALMSAYTHQLPAVRCVVSYYAPTDLNWDFDHPCKPDVIETKKTLENFMGRPPDGARDESYLSASPVGNISAHCPPTLLFQGGHDQVVHEENAEFLRTKLQDAGVPVSYVFLPSANHGFDWNLNSWNSQIARLKLTDFLSKYLAAS